MGGVLIVTRHAGLVAWLAERWIVGETIAHATPENVAGRAVIGALPLHLAALAESVTVVDMPGLIAEQRGRDLTPAEMDAAGASLSTFRVTRVPVAPPPPPAPGGFVVATLREVEHDNHAGGVVVTGGERVAFPHALGDEQIAGMSWCAFVDMCIARNAPALLDNEQGEWETIDLQREACR